MEVESKAKAPLKPLKGAKGGGGKKAGGSSVRREAAATPTIEDWTVDLDAIVRIVDGMAPPPSGGSDAESIFTFLARIPGAFEGEEEDSNFEDVLKRMILRACKTAEAMSLDSFGDRPDAPSPEDRSRMRRCLESLHYVEQAYGAATAAWKVASAREGEPATITDLVAGISRFSMADPAESNRVQKLILYLLNVAQTKGYRRRNGEMYRRVCAPKEFACYDTHAWERVCDMQEFVYESCRKEVNYEMWSNLTWAKVNLVTAIDYLQSCRDVQLPDLKKDRHVFSFEDGIYLAEKNRFCAYGTPEHAAIPTDVVAAKFFHMRFSAAAAAAAAADTDACGLGSEGAYACGLGSEGAYPEDASSWYSIPTPHLQSILDYQGMPREVALWMYVMIGRMIYELNEKDRWSVIPYLKGAASSGKSTILMHVCSGLYEPEDVGTLSNNIEKKFGISAFSEKFIFIGPEIKSDIKLEQAEFQSMVSGESVQIATKFKTAQAQKWKVPGALAGNEVPNWVDNSGSINRRILLFEFPKQVHDGDMELGKKIDEEMPSILVKSNRAYLSAVQLHAKKNIWNALPAAFHASKEELTENINSVVAFLRSGHLAFGANLYMPQENFNSAYENYAHAMGLKRIVLTGDKVNHPLMQVNCHIQKKQTYMRYPPGSSSMVKGLYVIGCDYAQDRHKTSPIQGDELD